MIAGLALAIALLLVPTAAEGRVGSLDLSFGERGSASTGLKPDAPAQMAIGPDGSIVVAVGIAVRGGSELTRFLLSGQLDQGFGTGGHLTLSEEIEGLPFVPSDIAIDSQGRVLVFGTAEDPDQQVELASPLTNVPVSWAVVLRLTPDGQLDSSFGEGRGFVRGDFGLRSEPPVLPPPDLPTARALTGKVDSQDRPVLIVGAAGIDSPCAGHSGQAWFPRAVVRLTTAGSPDPAFGGGDGISPLKGSPPSLTLGFAEGDQPVAAVGTESCPRSAMVFRFGADGAPFTGFGVDGARAYRGLTFSLVESSGALFLRRGSPTTHVIRVAPDGRRDRSFGKNGSTAVSMPPGARRTLRPVAVDARGHVLLAGSLVLPEPRKAARGKRVKRKQDRAFLVVGRLRARGKVDRGFGRRGWIMTPFARSSKIVSQQAALDPQGRLVALALVTKLHRPRLGFVLVRYLLGA